jgi:hypothetical protein
MANDRQADPSTMTPEWRTIESAPKDMTTVLLGWFETFGLDWADDPAPMYKVGFWHPRHRAWCDTHQVLHNQRSHPTHWMPLPAPPEGLCRKATKPSDVLGWMDSEGPVTRAPGKPLRDNTL